MTIEDKEKIMKEAKKSPLILSRYSPIKWETHQIIKIEDLEKILIDILDKGEGCS